MDDFKHSRVKEQNERSLKEEREIPPEAVFRKVEGLLFLSSSRLLMMLSFRDASSQMHNAPSNTNATAVF